MVENRYAKNTLIIFVASATLALFTYIFVDHHLGAPDRVQQTRTELLSGGSRFPVQTGTADRINAAPAGAKQTSVKVAAAAPARVNGQQVFQNACMACHGAGIAGAPKVGDAGQWAQRITKGLDTLYDSAINGLKGSAGVMPARGGYPALSDAEVKAAVDYIVAQLK